MQISQCLTRKITIITINLKELIVRAIWEVTMVIMIILNHTTINTTHNISNIHHLLNNNSNMMRVCNINFSLNKAIVVVEVRCNSRMVTIINNSNSIIATEYKEKVTIKTVITIINNEQ